MIIKIKAKPGSKKQEIQKVSEKSYVINIKEKAEDNKANISILKLLKKEFKCEAIIIKGKNSKNKLVELKCP